MANDSLLLGPAENNNKLTSRISPQANSMDTLWNNFAFLQHHYKQLAYFWNYIH